MDVEDALRAVFEGLSVRLGHLLKTKSLICCSKSEWKAVLLEIMVCHLAVCPRSHTSYLRDAVLARHKDTIGISVGEIRFTDRVN